MGASLLSFCFVLVLHGITIKKKKRFPEVCQLLLDFQVSIRERFWLYLNALSYLTGSTYLCMQIFK
jgi:hypothetical protein